MAGGKRAGQIIYHQGRGLIQFVLTQLRRAFGPDVVHAVTWLFEGGESQTSGCIFNTTQTNAQELFSLHMNNNPLQFTGLGL